MAADVSAGMQMRFFALGDYGSARPAVRRVGNAMDRRASSEFGPAPELVLGLGDNFYPCGVTSVTDKRFRQQWYAVLVEPNPRMHAVPWYVTLGNHDYLGSAEAQVKYTLHRSNQAETGGLWRMPARTYSERRALPDGSAIEFFCVDTSGCQDCMQDECRGLTQDSVRELARMLRASSARWKVVFGHHPIYTKSDDHGVDGDTLRTVFHLEQLMLDHGVVLYFAGHEHVLQYRAERGVHHFVVGASGGDFVRFYCREDPRRTMTWYDQGTSLTGFAEAAVFPDRIRVAFVGSDDREIFVADCPHPSSSKSKSKSDGS